MKGFPSITNSLEQSVGGLREGFQSLPKVKIGQSQPVQQQPVQQVQPTQPVIQQPIPPPQPVQQQYIPNSIDKAKFWIFWILTILIGGLATLLIIWRIISRFI